MSLTTITSDIIDGPKVVHGFFTREGGVSQGIYEGLNCGIGSNDSSMNILENRFLATINLSGRRDTPLLNCYQIHSNKVITVDGAWTDADRPKADAMVTAHPNLILSILTADCAPVLFFDPTARVIGAAHAGWQGALYGIIENTIAAMEALGASRNNILAAVGPTIGVKSYEVGQEFHQKFLDVNKSHAQYFWAGRDFVHYQFDLGQFVKAELEKAGIKKPWVCPEDTYTNESLFYSYRRSCHRSEADYGRQLSSIMLKA